MNDIELWQSLGVALAIGLLVGAERERSKPAQGTLGIRTMALLALVGALSTLVQPIVAGGLVAGAVLLVVLGYATSRQRDPGLTTEVAGVAVVGLGALATSRPAAAAALAVAITVLLVSRDALHRFVRETVTEREQADALKFFVAAFVLLPILPSGRFGPYGTWVPQRIWLLVVLITGIGWVGYVATRMLGARRGLMVTGLAGGFVSGTATTGVMAARFRRGEAPLGPALAGASLASVSTLLQLVVVTAIADPRVTARLLPAVVVGSAVLSIEAWWLARKQDNATADGAEPTGRPFALVPALVLAGIISGVLPLAVWMEQRYGAAGALAATATGAVADVHGASVAVATLAHDGRVSVSTAVVAVGLGLATNTVGKVVVAAGAGGARFAVTLAACLAPASAAFAAALLLW